jgi:cell wall-associated NlpC family hydrolase
MAAADPFNTFMSSLGNKPQAGVSPNSKSATGFNYKPFIVQQGQQTPGQQLMDKLGERKTIAGDLYQNARSAQTNRVAQDIAGKSAFNIPMDEFGQVKRELTDFKPAYQKQIQSTGQRGKLALQAEEAKTAWHAAKTMQDLGQFGFTGTIQGNGTDIPGATGDNPGAKAISLAMKALQNKTPYIWGGNSLSQGVDCSGLVQQVYRQLGISVPRTTYDQAKSGKQVSLNALRPGDLVFYRSGGRGPEHVGLYMGDGKYVHAANSKLGIITSSVFGSSNGAPLMAIRPY